METNKITLNRNALYFGLGLGIALIIFDLLFYVFDAPMKTPLRYLNLLIVMGFIVYGTLMFRNKLNNGLITYGRSFLSCFLIALYGGILFAIYYYLFVKFFDHSVIIKLREIAQEAVEQKNMPEEQIEQAMAFQRKYILIPFVISFGAIFNLAFWGAVFGLIVSIFLKKEDKSFNQVFKDVEPS
jgi:hypothetical protein